MASDNLFTLQDRIRAILDKRSFRERIMEQGRTSQNVDYAPDMSFADTQAAKIKELGLNADIKLAVEMSRLGISDLYESLDMILGWEKWRKLSEPEKRWQADMIKDNFRAKFQEFDENIVNDILNKHGFPTDKYPLNPNLGPGMYPEIDGTNGAD